MRDRQRWEGDDRRQIVRLTDAGRRSFAVLDRLPADAIDALLTPFDE
jgi:DNA-binding MarR family transcriptional regulator